MFGNEFNLLIDGMITLCGFLLLKNMLQMKRSGKLEKGFMLGKNFEVSTAKDPEGFIRYMYVKTVVLSVLLMATGVFQIVADLTGMFGFVAGITSFVLFGLLIVYAFFAHRAHKLYL